jgi:hypothetical protein
MSSRKITNLIPFFLKKASTGFKSLVNIRGVEDNPNGRQVN